MARREIAGLRVVVTGASSGIGRALALELVRRGAKVVVSARREERLRELVEKCRSLPGELEFVVGDACDDAVRRAILDQAQARFGGLDVLVNNAGIGAYGRFDEADPVRLRQVFEVNVFALIELTRAALPLLRQGRTPAVVNVGSIVGHRAVPLSAEYCASKFAVRGFSESLRAELAQDGIDVLLVSPGTTDTEIFENALAMTDLPWRRHEHQGETPEAVARAAVRAIERGTKEIIPSLTGRLLVLANRLAPRIVDWAMKRTARR